MIPLPKPSTEIIPYASEGGHWYDEHGNPVYEIMGRNGVMRPTTLRDARKYNLFPSVTGIIRCAANHGLERWKREQLLMAALTLPQKMDEGLKEFAERVVRDSEEQAVRARDMGTLIHGSIEKHLCGSPYEPEHKHFVEGALEALDKWCGLEGLQPEKSFAHELGYGGKTDIHKPPMNGWVTDFKSKEFDRSNLPKTYETHDMQLAAYREGFGLPHARCSIIFVSTSVPGLTHLVEVPEDDLARGWNMFQCLLRFWQIKNRYQPEAK